MKLRLSPGAVCGLPAMRLVACALGLSLLVLVSGCQTPVTPQTSPHTQAYAARVPKIAEVSPLEQTVRKFRLQPLDARTEEKPRFAQSMRLIDSTSWTLRELRVEWEPVGKNRSPGMLSFRQTGYERIRFRRVLTADEVREWSALTERMRKNGIFSPPEKLPSSQKRLKDADEGKLIEMKIGGKYQIAMWPGNPEMGGNRTLERDLWEVWHIARRSEIDIAVVSVRRAGEELKVGYEFRNNGPRKMWVPGADPYDVHISVETAAGPKMVWQVDGIGCGGSLPRLVLMSPGSVVRGERSFVLRKEGGTYVIHQNLSRGYTKTNILEVSASLYGFRYDALVSHQLERVWHGNVESYPVRLVLPK